MGLIGRLLVNKFSAGLLIRPVLRLHSKSYNLAGRLSALLNNGVHPKHGIIRYKEWFLENIKDGWVVMDIGCNNGQMPELLSCKAGFVYGIDMNRDLIAEAKAKRQKPNIEYICADATTYDFRDKAVDCVTLSNVLEHIRDRVDFLKKLVRNIKWNGAEKTFLIRVPTIEREWIAVYKKELNEEYRLDVTHHIEFTLSGFIEELAAADMEILTHHIRFGEIYAVCRAKTK